MIILRFIFRLITCPFIILNPLIGYKDSTANQRTYLQNIKRDWDYHWLYWWL